MRYVTIDDDTGAFVHVDDIRGVAAIDDEKQASSGYKSLIFTPNRDIGSPLDCIQVRARINNALGLSVSESMATQSANVIQ